MHPHRLGRLAASVALAVTSTSLPPNGPLLIETVPVQKAISVRAAARASRLTLKVTPAECPKAFFAKTTIAVFVCTVTIGGQPVPYTVTFDARPRTWSATSEVAVVSLRAIAAHITAELGLDRRSVVQCDGGRPVYVRPVGSTVDCTVSPTKSAGRTVSVRFAPGDGRVTLDA